METAMISISKLRIWFGFILLGCFFMAGKSVTYENCPKAQHNVSSANKRVVVKFPNCDTAPYCGFEFKNSTIKGQLRFKLPKDVDDISSICTRGSIYSKRYGELVYSSKVNMVTESNVNPGRIRRNKKNNTMVKKGQNVDFYVEYKYGPGNKAFTSSAGGKFVIEILPSCKENVKAWYCVWFPACISLDTANIKECVIHNPDSKT